MRKIVAALLSGVLILGTLVIPVFANETNYNSQQEIYANEDLVAGMQSSPLPQSSFPSPVLIYRSHVQNIGWMENVSMGELSGTTGRHLAMEAFSINLQNQDPSITGQHFIEYRAHVRNIGWQNFVGNGQIAGTTGRRLPIEAIQIRLVGGMAERFDIYYQVHVANVGWLCWARNGAVAGSIGASMEMQAMRVRLVERGSRPPGSTMRPSFSAPVVQYTTHVQNIGWQTPVQNGVMAGTSGRGLRLEGFRASLINNGLSGSIEYNVHVQDIGWQGFRSNWNIAGTTGRSLRLEAIQIRLVGEIAQVYDVYYRVHIQDRGWLDWAKNGQSAGSAGLSLRLEAIEVRLISRGTTNRPQNTRRPFVTLAAHSGTRGLGILETQLRNMTNNFPGRQSIYVKNLDTGAYMMLNNEVRHNPASLMKLFVVGAAHEQIARGRMQMTPQVRRWMTETITISTNDSYNWLLFHIGQGCVRRGLNQVTDFARRHGYTATIGGHSFGVHPQPSQVVVPGGNRTTARDVGLFMEDVYRGNIVSLSASNQIMASLRGQRRLNKIPAGLPAGVPFGSKTGEWAGYEHDAAIVFSRGATYVIVVMSTPGANSIQNIRTISRHVFNHFN